MKLQQQQQQQKVFRYFQCFMKFGQGHDGNPDEIIVLMRAFYKHFKVKWNDEAHKLFRSFLRVR